MKAYDHNRRAGRVCAQEAPGPCVKKEVSGAQASLPGAHQRNLSFCSSGLFWRRTLELEERFETMVSCFHRQLNDGLNWLYGEDTPQ